MAYAFPPAGSSSPSPDTSSIASPVELFGEHVLSETADSRCSLCQEICLFPKILPCLHTFCQPCLETNKYDPNEIPCPKCSQDFAVSDGLSAFLADYAASNTSVPLVPTSCDSAPLCNSCKTKEFVAVAYCVTCLALLCENCYKAHQYMNAFDDHLVRKFGEPPYCLLHKEEILRYFCKPCNIPVCKECIHSNHSNELHEYENISEFNSEQIKRIMLFFEQCKAKVDECAKLIDPLSSLLQVQYSKAKVDIMTNFSFCRDAAEKQRNELMKELDGVFSCKVNSLNILDSEIKEKIEEFEKSIEYSEKVLHHSSVEEILMLKKDIESRLNAIQTYDLKLKSSAMQMNLCNEDEPTHLEFISNFQAIQNAIQNNFGYIRHCNNSENVSSALLTPKQSNANVCESYQTFMFPGNENALNFKPQNSFGSLPSDMTDVSCYQKWSNGSADAFQIGTFQASELDSFNTSPESSIDLVSDISSLSIYPLKSHVQRRMMTYHSKFGDTGTAEGQFSEPSGVACNNQNEIIVADANSFRVQVFDKHGKFKFHFGKSTSMQYPNRVAVINPSGDIVVTERSPSHQIRIYNQYGQFVRNFGSDELQHPRGLAVDSNGRIIIVESKIMKVVIFDQFGAVLSRFNCSNHLKFPNAVAVNNKYEIFISDNKEHCVKVFDYNGVFLRTIGGRGLTNFPIGVLVGQNNEVLVADNHNNFNLTIFTEEGQFLYALESKVKHAKCLDVALMDDYSVVLATKDNRLYIYSYK